MAISSFNANQTGATSSAASGAASAASTAAGAARASGGNAFNSMVNSMIGQDTSATAAATSSVSTSSSSATSSSATADDGGADRFLKLLVAQMNNQDPLNPMDNAQVTSQLAQINTVKGIDQLNGTMQKLLDRFQTGGPADAVPMVGRQVLVPGETLDLPADGVAKAGFELRSGASAVTIDVLDASGKVIESQLRKNVQAGIQTFAWDGTAGGKTMPAGTYGLRITAVSGGKPVDATALTAATVQAALKTSSGTSLQLGGLGSRPLSDVRGVL
jgi:flagellar basal-body rod modification protein FlgD